MIKGILEVILSGLLVMGIGGDKEPIREGIKRIGIENIDISENIKEEVQGTKIYITQNEIEEMSEYKKYFEEGEKQYSLGSIGIYDSVRGVIYVEDVANKDYVLLHELMHSYDNKDGKRLSDGEDFRIIHQQEAERVFNKNTYPDYSDELLSYYKDQRHEYYAECFAIYKTYPDFLKQVAPMTFNYMEKIDK